MEFHPHPAEFAPVDPKTCQDIALTVLKWTVLCAAVAFAFLVNFGPAQGRENDEWQKNDPEINEFYRNTMQPDNPTVSCCGQADAYWADSFEMLCEEKDGKKECLYVAIITDARDIDGRPTRPVGTKVVIPNHKIKSFNDAGAKGNPTGHGIVFLGPGWNEAMNDGRDYVYCYLPTGGV